MSAGSVLSTNTVGPIIPETVAPRVIYARLFASHRPNLPVPEISVEFRKYANASAQISLSKDLLRIKIADTLASAPEDVHEALADILLSKLFRKPVAAASNRRYRQYLNRHDIRENLNRVRSVRGRKRFDAPSGQHYDLVELFEALNFKYFFGLMQRPALGWSVQISRSLLGHYDPSHHAIVLNRIMDRPDVPRLAVEYVMFHEMLHLRHPTEHRGSRRCVHTPAFKKEEKSFEGWREAKALLKTLMSRAFRDSR
ncbi:MAG: M48 family peptidase [Acidobacteriota bacterium]